jgi:hypothetical protein
MKNVDIFVCRTKQSIEECVAPSFKPGSECFPSRKCRVHFSVDSGLLVVKRWDSKLRGSAMKLSEHAANARCRVGKQYTLEVMTATGWRAGEAWRERRSSCLLSALYYSSARSLVISGMLAFRLTAPALAPVPPVELKPSREQDHVLSRLRGNGPTALVVLLRPLVAVAAVGTGSSSQIAFLIFRPFLKARRKPVNANELPGDFGSAASGDL